MYKNVTLNTEEDMNDLYKSVHALRELTEKSIATSANPKFKELKQDIINNIQVVIKSKVALQCQNYPQLYTIYDSLIGEYAKLMLMPSDINDFHKHVYSFFAKVCNISQPAKYFQHHPTKLFEEFIKGITLFKTEEHTVLSKPSYHRPKSCGSKTMNFETKFTMLPSDDKHARESKTKALRMCIIERKIYDAIFKHILKQQDAGHLVELMNLERLYMNYTSYKIDVNVHFKYDVLPYMAVIRTYQHNNLAMVETYEKRSNGIVLVERHYRKDTRVHDVHKDVQTYDGSPVAFVSPRKHRSV